MVLIDEMSAVAAGAWLNHARPIPPLRAARLTGRGSKRRRIPRPDKIRDEDRHRQMPADVPGTRDVRPVGDQAERRAAPRYERARDRGACRWHAAARAPEQEEAARR